MRVQIGVNPSNYKFTDQELDAENGLYNYNARLYDPFIGRFISPDSIIPQPYNPQSLNRYSYCLNNPLIYTDPSGHDSQEEGANKWWEWISGALGWIFSHGTTSPGGNDATNDARFVGDIRNDTITIGYGFTLPSGAICSDGVHCRGELLYLRDREHGTYHVGFDQGNNQILLLNMGDVRTADLNKYLEKNPQFDLVGYADITDYISADSFIKNVRLAEKSLERNYDDYNQYNLSATWCVDVVIAGMGGRTGSAFTNLRIDMHLDYYFNSDPNAYVIDGVKNNNPNYFYFYRRNINYITFFKSEGKIKK